MLEVIHIAEPRRLWLTWQPRDGGRRYLVGQIDRLEDGAFTYRYHSSSDSFHQAEGKGFVGYPAFDIGAEQHSNNVLAPFMRRLPPRKRGDFKTYLAQYLLSHPFDGSEFALLAYTGAKSPGDGFSLLPDFSGLKGDIDYQLEVVGTRYELENGLDLGAIQTGDVVTFTHEPDNQYDPYAIAIAHNGQRLGYVNKVLCDFISKKLADRKISAVVSRKNGTSERPLIYVLLKIRE